MTLLQTSPLLFLRPDGRSNIAGRPLQGRLSLSEIELLSFFAEPKSSDLAIDAKFVGQPDGLPGWEIFTHGGRQPTGIDAVAWAEKMAALGAGEILLTSMDQDGVKNGYDLGVTRAISDAVNVPIIASGGVGNLEHLVAGVIQGGADAVLAASIFHFNEYSIPEAKQYMAKRGIEMRL